MSQIRLEVVTPTGRLIETDADVVTAPGAMGEFSVLHGHRGALIMLGGGAVRYSGPTSGAVYVRGGVAEIAKDRVLILVDEGCTPDAIDKSRGQALLDGVNQGLEAQEFMSEDRELALRVDRAYAEAIISA